MCWGQDSTTAQHSQPQNSSSTATDRPGKHGGGVQWPATQLWALGPRNQRALCAWRSPAPLRPPVLRNCLLLCHSCLGFLNSSDFRINRFEISVYKGIETPHTTLGCEGSWPMQMPRIPIPPFSREAWSLGSGVGSRSCPIGLGSQGGWKACSPLWPLPGCTGEVQRGLFGFFNYHFYFFLLMKKF